MISNEQSSRGSAHGLPYYSCVEKKTEMNSVQNNRFGSTSILDRVRSSKKSDFIP